MNNLKNNNRKNRRVTYANFDWVDPGQKRWTEHHNLFDDHRGKGPRSFRRSDERIWERLCDCLCDDPHVDASNIEVTVNNGEVTLTGFVETRSMKKRAEDLTYTIQGVQYTENLIRVKQPE